MDFHESMRIHHHILLQDGERRSPIPPWAKAEIWLGWWCRRWQLDNMRLLVVAVLPTRDLGAAFTGLGCLLAGVQRFHGGFTWEDLRNLPVGSEIFWKDKQGKRNGGFIVEPDASFSDMVCIRPSLGPIKSLSAWRISESTFNNHIFSEDQLPTPRYSESMQHGLAFYRHLWPHANSKWIWTAGAEACIATNQTRFVNALDRLGLVVGASELISMEDALCLASASERRLAKLLIAPATKPIEKAPPVKILDGREAFDQIGEIDSGNVLILLDRSEYSSEVHNLLLDARNAALEPASEMSMSVPASLPPGIELSAYCLPKE